MSEEVVKRNIEITKKAIKAIEDAVRIINHKNQKIKEIIKDIEMLKEQIRNNYKTTEQVIGHN